MFGEEEAKMVLYCSLKKNIRYDTIIKVESIRTQINIILSKYRKIISFV